MTTFNTSTRSAKRRKISNPDSPALPSQAPASLEISRSQPVSHPEAPETSILEARLNGLGKKIPAENRRRSARKGQNNKTYEDLVSLGQAPLRIQGLSNSSATSSSPRITKGVNKNTLDTPGKHFEGSASQTNGLRYENSTSRARRKAHRLQPGSQDEDTPQHISRLAGSQSPTRTSQIKKRITRTHERSNGAAGKGQHLAASSDTLEEVEAGCQETKTKTTEDKRVRSSDDEEADPLNFDLSARRIQNQPRRYSIENGQSTKPTQTPTPGSGRKRGRPRKVVEAAGTPRKKKDSDFDFKKINRRFGADSDGKAAQLRISEDPISSVEPAEIVRGTPRKKQEKFSSATQSSSYAETSITSLESLQYQDGHHDLEKAASELQHFIQGDQSNSLAILKTQILAGLTGKRRLPLVNLEVEFQKVHQLVEQTVAAGEGNSMLVIGSRGTAKTTLVETVIADLALDRGEDFHVVRLNGFIHTDDKLALREIWRQLGREMEVEDDTLGIRSSYADTLTSLLALLSHSEAIDDRQDERAKSVIFIIDEFDLFASHPRQTLLYNLFDVAQSRNAPIAVLGLTTKIDVVESLEKRVKSRFGQRYVHLSLPRTLSAFQAICESALIPQPSQITISNRLNPTDELFQRLLSAWRIYISALFREDTILQKHLLKTYTLSKSIPTFLASCLLPIHALPALPTGSSFSTLSLSPPDSKIALMAGLSDLSLTLLITAARLDIVLDSDLCNFPLCYDEYVALATKSRIQSSATGAHTTRLWSQDVARAAWEVLVAVELVVEAGAGMWRVEVGLEEIARSGVVSRAMEKWCREI